jgi:hypothetical protein
VNGGVQIIILAAPTVFSFIIDAVVDKVSTELDVHGFISFNDGWRL